MIDVHARPQQLDTGPSASLATHRGRATGELHAIAFDLLGRPELDELSPDERDRLALEVDEAVTHVLAVGAGSGAPGSRALVDRLAAELSSRVEALPLHLRVALANARRRSLLGVD